MSGRRDVEMDDCGDYVREHVAAQMRSGLSVRRYCEQENLNVSTFYGWRHRARSAAFIEVLPAAPGGHIDDSGVEVLLDGHVRVRVSRDFDEATLVRVVRVLDGRAESC